MAKYFGSIGYAVTREIEPGIYVEEFVVQQYYGDIIRNSRRLQDANKVNPDFSLSNRFSILADPFANSHFHEMRYIEYMGTKWKITEVEVQYPRLILTVGGIYNE